MEIYKKSDFAGNGIEMDIVQDNYSSSSKDVLRGLHYQTHPAAQGKLVKCIKGKIFDVAVDIRKSSPTFGRWVGCELSDHNSKMFWIPAGFAHGFLTLSDHAEITYKITGAEYTPSYERCIRWNDPDIAIDWPSKDVILAVRDAEAPLLKDAEVF